MADAKITDCAELTDATIAEGDMFPVVDVGTPSVNKRISLANIRSSLTEVRYGDTIYVPATGSNADAANIQAAIDELTYTTSDMESGCVLLSGQYNINTPLRVGGDLTDGVSYDGTNTNKPVSLIGIGNAVFYWTGSVQDDYMLWFIGEGVSAGPRIANIYFNCNHETRGIFLGHQAYSAEICNCYIQKSRKVGLDVDSCYNIGIRNVMFTSGRGILLRTYGSPGIIENCSFNSGYGVHHLSNVSDDNEAVVNYEMINGEAAAITEYGANYVNAFPAVDDTVSPHYASGYVQTAENARAAVVVQTSAVRMQGINLEILRYGHYPCITLSPGSGSLESVRCEGNQNSECVVRLIGTSSQYYGKTFYIGGIQCGITTGAANECKAVVEIDCSATSATSFGNHIERISGTTITEAVVKYKAGTHSNNRVERCYLSNAAIPMELASDGAVVTGSLDPVSLPVFANATARDAEWTAPLAGWSCFLTDPGKVTTYSGAAWVIHEIPA